MAAIPNYSTYSLDELHDAESTVDVEKYPERHALIVAEIERRRQESANERLLFPVRLSSDATAFHQYGTPALMLVVAIAMAIKGFGDTPQGQRGMVLGGVAAMVAMAAFVFGTTRLRHVTLHERSLTVRGFRTTTEIDLADVIDATERTRRFSRRNNTPYVTLELRTPSAFGETITFLANRDLGWQDDGPMPIAKRIVQLARNRRAELAA